MAHKSTAPSSRPALGRVALEISTAAWSPDATPFASGGSPTTARLAAGAFSRGLAPGQHIIDVTNLDGARLTAVVEGLLLGAYSFSRATSGQADQVRVALAVGDGEDVDETVVAGRRAAEATIWARDLSNTRSAVKTPEWLGQQAATMLGAAGVEVDVRGPDWLQEKGFGGVLAVGGGSSATPRLIEARWKPKGARQGIHVTLIGKGITFDSGGLNRKTGASMTTMYTDMSGGAAVLGAMQAIAAARLPVHVTALVPAAENSISGASYRPGDVVRHVGGRTSEIGNTDAEGRLVLADALAYAASALRPTALVDIATLTGAAKKALGLRTGGLFANSEPLADGLLEAGEATGEPLWRLPMPAEYESSLHSSIADATNAPGGPGAITAALFLRPFATDVPWAHLDVAGPARAAEDDGMIARGGTGFGARLLARWVASLA